MSKWECFNCDSMHPCVLDTQGVDEYIEPQFCPFDNKNATPKWKQTEPQQFGNSEQLTIRFKKLHPDAKAPYQATVGSAGFDLTAVSREVISEYHTKYDTGLAVEIPAGHVGLVFPRSSIYKTDTILTNCVGVIDSDYRGSITAVFAGRTHDKEYKVGDRICQLVIMPIPAVRFVEAETLTETQRGTGGYGSTGK